MAIFAVRVVSKDEVAFPCGELLLQPLVQKPDFPLFSIQPSVELGVVVPACDGDVVRPANIEEDIFSFIYVSAFGVVSVGDEDEKFPLDCVVLEDGPSEEDFVIRVGHDHENAFSG